MSLAKESVTKNKEPGAIVATDAINLLDSGNSNGRPEKIVRYTVCILNDIWVLFKCTHLARGMFSSWVVQRGTFKTDPGPLEENYVAHIMTQQNTR